MKSFFLLLSLSFAVLSSQADEVRPAYLEVKELSKNAYALVLKSPLKAKKQVPIEVVLEQECKALTPVNRHYVSGASIQRWRIECKGGLAEKTLSIKGLKASRTDLLLRLEFLDKSSQTMLLTPSKTRYTVPKEASAFQIIQTYTGLGITHILFGYDHLLFVFALLLIVKSMRRLLWTITAFTLAHSITMISATLGLVSAPQQPVEAIIALSIVFLAMEIVHETQNRPGITSRYPWLIAFVFGLLHGFGFAGALAEIGLPQQAIGLALVFFNIGVEVGQLLFVFFIVLLAILLNRLHLNSIIDKSKIPIVYMMGTLSSFWFIERISGF